MKFDIDTFRETTTIRMSKLLFDRCDYYGVNTSARLTVCLDVVSAWSAAYIESLEDIKPGLRKMARDYFVDRVDLYCGFITNDEYNIRAEERKKLNERVADADTSSDSPSRQDVDTLQQQQGERRDSEVEPSTEDGDV